MDTYEPKDAAEAFDVRNGSALDFRTRLRNNLVGIARQIESLKAQECKLRALNKSWSNGKASAKKGTRGNLTWLLQRQSRAAMLFFGTMDTARIAESEIKENDE